MKGLLVENLCVGYGRREVLKNISLKVAPGQIVAVLGENGCGKTTLLRAIGGTVSVSSGRILVDDTDLSGCRPRRRAAYLATMPQICAAEAGVTGMDRVEMSFFPDKGLFGRLTQVEREEILAMAQELNMTDLLSRDLSKMSAGERQMIFLLAAAVRGTPVLLLDEPSSALDFNRTEEMFALLHRLAERGSAILTVLHDPTQALRHASAILRLDGNGAERIDLTDPDYEVVQRSLRRLYPHLKIHRDPLFCVSERETVKSEDSYHADH